MKLGIMQPYFFPYIGYFALINYTDRFIFFDTPQYIHHGWVNRNRILTQDGNSKYIIVPIKKKERTASIKETVIDNRQNWKEAIYGSLTVYKKKAPNYREVMEIIDEIFANNYDKLSVLNITTIKRVCEYLGIQTPFETYSEMELDVADKVKEADEWALYITKEMGYDTYVNPPGGEAFFDRNKFRANHIELQFLKTEGMPYIQRTGRFEPALSIVDVMMFCNKKQIKEMLDYYTIF